MCVVSLGLLANGWLMGLGPHPWLSEGQVSRSALRCREEGNEVKIMDNSTVRRVLFQSSTHFSGVKV